MRRQNQYHSHSISSYYFRLSYSYPLPPAPLHGLFPRLAQISIFIFAPSRTQQQQQQLCSFLAPAHLLRSVILLLFFLYSIFSLVLSRFAGWTPLLVMLLWVRWCAAAMSTDYMLEIYFCSPYLLISFGFGFRFSFRSCVKEPHFAHGMEIGNSCVCPVPSAR